MQVLLESILVLLVSPEIADRWYESPWVETTRYTRKFLDQAFGSHGARDVPATLFFDVPESLQNFDACDVLVGGRHGQENVRHGVEDMILFCVQVISLLDEVSKRVGQADLLRNEKLLAVQCFPQFLDLPGV